LKTVKNKYLFFFLRIIKDLANPTQWPITGDLTSKTLGEYYFLFSEKAVQNQKGGQKSVVLDNDGIPMNPTYIDVKDKDYVYYPITIGQVGLAVFHSWLQSKDDFDKKRFLKFVNWFSENAEIDPKLGARWLTDVALPQYHNPGPWQSAFTQSRAISILLRGYQLTSRDEYRQLAEKALIPFDYPVTEGGVTSFTEFGPFYEEYTAEVPTLVLNGMIFSLCGIYDFVRVFPDHEIAMRHYQDGIKTLTNIIKEYDTGYWSRYNLCKADWYPEIDLATITYQHLHISQLELVYRLTNNEIFKTYAVRFKKQINAINILKMYRKKYRGLKKLKRL
jgi:hypothetical protein